MASKKEEDEPFLLVTSGKPEDNLSPRERFIYDSLLERQEYVDGLLDKYSELYEERRIDKGVNRYVLDQTNEINERRESNLV